MRQTRLPAQLSIRLDNRQRAVIEQLGAAQNLSIGEAARLLIDAGIIAKRLKC
jgi:hypothetical protein